MAVTIHCLTKKFEYNSFVYQVQPFSVRHKGENIAFYVNEVVEKEGLQHLSIAAVVDQSSNMAAALRKSKCLSLLDENSMQCTDHKLNNCLRKASESDPLLSLAFRTVRELLSKIHHSTSYITLLENECISHNIFPLKIPTYCETRWNIHLQLIDAILRMRYPLLKLKFDLF